MVTAGLGRLVFHSQQQRAENGNDGERDDERSRHAGDGGDRDGGEQFAFEPFQTHEGKEDEDDDEGREVEESGSEFTGGSEEEDSEERRGARGAAMAPQGAGVIAHVTNVLTARRDTTA